MRQRPEILHRLLQHLTQCLIQHLRYQIASGVDQMRPQRINGSVLGAQMVQLFDSWAHHLSPDQFRIFSLPYAESIIRAIKNEHPDVPVVFHMNGGTGKLEYMSFCSADVIGLDWHIEMQTARGLLGSRILQVTSASFPIED